MIKRLHLSKLVLSALLLLIIAAQAMAQVNYANAVSSVGIYYPNRGEFFLQDSDDSGVVNVLSITGVTTSALPLAGAWTTGGWASIGLYDRSTANFYLKDSTTSSGPADTTVNFGSTNTNYIPVAGDWTDKGYDSIGYYNPTNNTFYLKNTNTGGAADLTLVVLTNTGATPPAGSVPIVGDWVGDGVCRVGFYDPATYKYYLRMTNTPSSKNCAAGVVYEPTSTVSEPIIGKWKTTMTTVGLGTYTFPGNTVFLRNALTAGGPNNEWVYVPQGHQDSTPALPIVGKWLPTHSLSAGQNTSPTSPSWLANQIQYELRIETLTDTNSAGANTPGTFAAATTQLPYLQSLGVTGIIVDPPEANGGTNPDNRQNNAYSNYEPGVLEPRLGTDSDFSNFVTQAHADGMKVFADTVQHGISPKSPDITSFPVDYFSHNSDGTIYVNSWGADQLDWTSPGLLTWWMSSTGVALNWVNKYGLDGFRMDLEPSCGSYPLLSQIKAQVLSSTGKQLVLIPEEKLWGTKRAYTYDISQNDYTIDHTTGLLNDPLTGAPAGDIATVVKSCTENYYTCGLTNHDSTSYGDNGEISRFAYGMLLSPFIPRWFMGDEFDATPDYVSGNHALYFNQLHLSQQATNIAFFNQVQQLVQLRKTYLSILASGTGALQNDNIADAAFVGSTTTDLPPYTMWNGGSSITVVASNLTPTGGGTVNVTLPLSTMGFTSNYFQCTDLVGGTTTIYSNSQVGTTGIPLTLAQGGVVPILVQTPILYDKFDRTSSNISGTSPTTGTSTWTTSGAGISTDGTKAIISLNGGVVGSGNAVADYAFTPAANTIYTLQGTGLFNGPVGTGQDCWLGMGFSNHTTGANYASNVGPWMLIRPQATSTSSATAQAFTGSTAYGTKSLAASLFSSPPTPVTYEVVWNTLTGQELYYVNGVLDWTKTTTMPSGTYYAIFQGYQSGNSVNVQNISLTSQPAGP